MKEELLLVDPEFPLSNKYDPKWVLENEMGPNALWLSEWVATELALKPGMRVLDMGCGKAISSIFLAKEYGVTVFANDLWIDPYDNLQGIQAMGMQDRVFPIRAEAHSLPFSRGFFDAIISIDSYHYYGTDEYYIFTISDLLKEGGRIGIGQPGLVREFSEVPEHLLTYWEPGMITFHTAAWWRKHWEKTKRISVIIADNMTNACEKHVHFLQDHQKAGFTYRNRKELDAFEKDQNRYLTFVRVIGSRV